MIGLGIDYRLNLPSEIIEEIKNCKSILWDSYTSPAPYTKNDIEKILNREIVEVGRSELEEDIEDIIHIALEDDIAFLVNGDPFIATTHSYIMKTAKDLGVKICVYHNSSIISAAIGESGLHIYKFGPSGTIVREKKASNRRNSLILEDNLRRGLHTLFFLEYDKDENYIMDPYEALNQIKEYPVVNKLDKLDPYIIILCGIGYKECIRKVIRYSGWREELYKLRPVIKMRKLPCIVIITGKLHFTEKEYIDNVLGDG